MLHDELIQKLSKETISQTSFFGRPLVVIPFEHFRKYGEHFVLSYNPFNKQFNYRTKSAFKHIHAVQSGRYIEFHTDFFNPSVSVFLAIPHLFVSVIPYFISIWFQGRKPYTIDL